MQKLRCLPKREWQRGRPPLPYGTPEYGDV
jgi:hypothetical protein